MFCYNKRDQGKLYNQQLDELEKQQKNIDPENISAESRRQKKELQEKLYKTFLDAADPGRVDLKNYGGVQAKQSRQERLEKEQKKQLPKKKQTKEKKKTQQPVKEEQTRGI